MMELQEKRRSLQAVLSSRLAELRFLCLQEAELTGKVPSDYPLETEEPPLVRRSVGVSYDKMATRPELGPVGGASSPLGGGATKDAVQHSSSEALSEEASRPSPSRPGPVQYGDLLQECVWSKQHKLQLQRQLHSNSRQPIVCQIPPPPLLLRGHPGEPGRVKVTRTKSCGPFLSPEPPEVPISIQPDAHPRPPHPRPPHALPSDHTQADPARTLHKALALEGLRDWYLRNTSGSAQLSNGRVNGSAADRREGGGRAHGVIQQLAYQRETHQHAPQKHPIETQHLYAAQMQHSVTFHGRVLHDRSVDGSLYQDLLSKRQELPLEERLMEQPSPGTLV
ncbi:unnamed protein product [Merluccius merluccius]